MKETYNELEKSGDSRARTENSHARTDYSHARTQSHERTEDRLQDEVWSERTKHAAAKDHIHGKHASGDTETKSSSHSARKLKLPPTIDPTEERKKLSENEKAIYDGINHHNGII